MRYWWVNHSQSWENETYLGALWSPIARKDNARHQPYDNMLVAQPGDLVFSFANTYLSFVGIVENGAIPQLKPAYAKDANWASDGWLLAVTFAPLEQRFRPRDVLNQITPLLPQKGISPLQTNGKGTMNYLCEISQDLAIKLLQLSSTPFPISTDSTDTGPVIHAINSAAVDQSPYETERVQLLRSRIGQGIFRAKVAAIDPVCRLTGVSELPLLRASHIKAWKDSTNSERLDGSNGLMLAPHVDHLFDRHLISFQTDGRLIVSRRLSANVLRLWAIREPAKPKPLTAEQDGYMAEHRKHL